MILSKEHKAMIDQAVSTAFEGQSWSLETELMRGLSSSKLYQIAIDSRFYVAKMTDPNDPIVDLKREYHANRMAAQGQIAPPVHYADADQGMLLMTYVDVIDLGYRDRLAADKIVAVGQFVRRLHALDHFKAGVTALQRFDFIYAQLSADTKSNHWVVNAIKLKQAAQQDLFDPKDLRPSHGDIGPYNLLFNRQQFFLIDWQMATQDSLYFDLACCAIFFYFLNEADVEQFLQAYMGRPLSAEEKNKFHKMRTFVSVYYAMGFLYISQLQGAGCLSEQAIAALPSYQQCTDLLESGEISLNAIKTQQQLAFILLKDLPGNQYQKR